MVLQGVSSCSFWSFILTVFQFEALEKLKVFCTHMCMPAHQIEVFAIAWYCGRLYEAVPSGAQSLEVHKGLAPVMQTWPENLKFHIVILSKDIYVPYGQKG